MVIKEIDLELEPGLRYTEETGRIYRSVPVRDCLLWKEGVDEPISGLNIVSIQQRFGAESLPCEGIGGVETVPQFRRQGYMRRLVLQALKGISRRVKAVFVADAVEDIYQKFGFVSCVPEAHMTLLVRNVERLAGNSQAAGNGRHRQFRPADLPLMAALYNQIHHERPGTHVRQASWNRLRPAETWRPGSEVLIYERDGSVGGYAILPGQRFGSPPVNFMVDELAAEDEPAAQALLAALADRCWQLRIGAFRVHEPLDTAAGRAAREIGCRYEQSFSDNSGMMGLIIDRPGLLRDLEPELTRRLPDAALYQSHAAAFAELASGAMLPSDQTLLRLLMGYSSFAELESADTKVPDRFWQVCQTWFPGGNTWALPQPFAHLFDRY